MQFNTFFGSLIKEKNRRFADLKCRYLLICESAVNFSFQLFKSFLYFAKKTLHTLRLDLIKLKHFYLHLNL